MAKKEVKTNVMRILDTEGITYQEHTYDVSDDLIDGVSVAQKCGEDPEQVFKTLVTKGDDGNHYVFVIPVKEKLDLKACARAVGVKSVAMLPQKELLKTTGYVHGGCSPIGMKKKFDTYFDCSINECDKIALSAGKRGYQMIVEAKQLLAYLDAVVGDVIRR